MRSIQLRFLLALYFSGLIVMVLMGNITKKPAIMLDPLFANIKESKINKKAFCFLNGLYKRKHNKFKNLKKSNLELKYRNLETYTKLSKD